MGQNLLQALLGRIAQDRRRNRSQKPLLLSRALRTALALLGFETIGAARAACSHPGGVSLPQQLSRSLGLPLHGAVMPEDHFACGEKQQQQQKNEFAFLNGNQCGKQSRQEFRCHLAPHRCCVKRQHPVCWHGAPSVSPGCLCVPGNRRHQTAPSPRHGEGVLAQPHQWDEGVTVRKRGVWCL